MALGLTNENVAFWVTSCEDSEVDDKCVTLFGRPFTWDHGLGMVGPDEDIRRSFHGQIALIGENKIILPEIDITSVHYLRLGFAWRLRKADCETMPRPPFVVTDLTDIERVYNSLVNVELTSGYIESVKEQEKIDFVVRTPDWFGVIDQFDLVSGTAHLIAFLDSIGKWPSEGACQILNMEAEGPVADVGIVKWPVQRDSQDL